MSPQELQESLVARGAGGNDDVQYVDVREEGEARLASLPHFQLLPLSKCVGALAVPLARCLLHCM